jgi:hypothetical protein
MEETAQNFEKRYFFINRSQTFIVFPKFYATHRNYEILSKSMVLSTHTALPSPLYGQVAEWQVMAAKVATVLGSIPASFATVDSEGRQKKQC